MPRCTVCGDRIWPWQHLGFRVERAGRTYWHSGCVRVRRDAAGAPALTAEPLEHRPANAGALTTGTAAPPAGRDA